MADAVIRRLAAADAMVLQACRLAALQDSPEAFVVTYEEVKDTPIPSVAASLEDPNTHWLGACVDDELVGFMRFVRPVALARRHTAEVHSVYVRAAHRGRQVAQQLLAQLIADARDLGLETLTLWVFADNAAARHLYESFGFRLIGTEPRACRTARGDVDEVHYWLPLVRSDEGNSRPGGSG